jgi:hypothetical protein
VRLADDLALLSERPDTEDFSRFRGSIDPAWIDQALSWTGTATLRKRRLPASQVVWLVIGMALLRNRPIRDVVDKLDLALGDDQPLLAPSSIAEARARLGEEPMLWLFARTAHAWAHASAARDRWKGLALYGVDGTTLPMPDTRENTEHFGKSNGKHGVSGYPMLRMAALIALRSHLVASAAFGPYATSEHYLAAELWSALPENSLTIVDRGFFAANILLTIGNGAPNRHWLIRAKTNTRTRVLKVLGPGDELVEMEVSAQARAQNPSLPSTWIARSLHYQRKGFQPQRLLTSLLDVEKYPAEQIAELYHLRWELELAYDELKTEMNGGTSSILRSKSPGRVNQEMWGLLQAYNLVRYEMEQIADEAQVPPTRISFATVFNMICDEWLWLAGTATPGAIPRQLKRLRSDVRRVVLPERRNRTYPRAIKVKTPSRYPRKRA